MTAVRRVAVAALITTAALTSAACADPSIGTGGKLRVVAAENFYGDLAAQLGGRHVQVTSVLSSPDADPHLFEPGSRTGLQVTRADVVIENGVGYDTWMDRLLAASPSRHRRVVTAARVLHVGGNDPNPHLWYDVAAMPHVVRAMAAAFIAADPRHAQDYRHRLRLTLGALQPLQDAVTRLKHRHAGAPVAYTERVPGLLLAEAGLVVLTPPGFARAVEDGTDPSAADVLRMRQLLTQHNVAALLYNEQATSPVTRQLVQLARRVQVPVVPVTETVPPGAGYESWQLGQINQLARALDL
jgi:zinc/manganese transport system substrate-binding protein